MATTTCIACLCCCMHVCCTCYFEWRPRGCIMLHHRHTHTHTHTHMLACASERQLSRCLLGYTTTTHTTPTRPPRAHKWVMFAGINQPKRPVQCCSAAAAPVVTHTLLSCVDVLHFCTTKVGPEKATTHKRQSCWSSKYIQQLIYIYVLSCPHVSCHMYTNTDLPC